MTRGTKPRRLHGSRIGAARVYRCARCRVTAATKKALFELCEQGGFGCDPQHFASTGELNRFAQLELLQVAGRIAGLRRQVAYPIRGCDCGRGPVVGKYRADYQYDEGGKTIPEDWHPISTDLAERNFKCMAAQGTPVCITGRRT